MACQNENCKSERIVSLTAKCSDCCGWDFKGINFDGYVPGGIGVGGGDYVEIDYCLQCGQIQGKWPVDDPQKYAELKEGLELVKSGDWDAKMFKEEYPSYAHLLEDDEE